MAYFCLLNLDVFDVSVFIKKNIFFRNFLISYNNASKYESIQCMNSHLHLMLSQKQLWQINLIFYTYVEL